MPGNRLNDVYAEILQNHPYGYALYAPESSLTLKPGTCGFLDQKGAWTPLLDLSNAAAVHARGFTPFHDFSPAPPKSGLWGPKGSEGVTGVNVEAVLKFSSEKESGVLLLAKGNVTRDFVHFRQPYKVWCKANAERILDKWPDVEQRGLWVVTETWHATEVALNAWQNSPTGACMSASTSLTRPRVRSAPRLTGTSLGATAAGSFRRRPIRLNAWSYSFLRYSRIKAKLVERAPRFQFRSTEPSFNVKDRTPADQRPELTVEMKEFGEDQDDEEDDEEDDE